MRHHAAIQPCGLRGQIYRFFLAITVAAVAGCGEHNPTEPIDTEDLPATAAAPVGAVASATRLPRSFFVDPGLGSDANPGTKLKPFKTLAHGLSLAIGGDSMRLAAGVYSKETNGEKFTNGAQQVMVPAGVKIFGTLAGELTSRLRGDPTETGLNLKGAATVKNLVITGFGTGIRATAGVQALNNLTLSQSVLAVGLSGSAKATLAGSVLTVAPIAGVTTAPVGAKVTQQAELIVAGGAITGGGQNCHRDVVGVSLADAARLTLKNVATLENIAGVGLAMFGTSKATLTGFARIKKSFFQLSESCTPRASILTFDSASLTLRHAQVESNGGTRSIGIESHSSAPLTLDTAGVAGHTEAGIVATGSFKLVAKAASLRQNAIGLDAAGAPNADITITGSTVSLNGIGIRSPFFKLRNSVVTNNSTGILLTSQFTDLGQTFDPGNNAIKDNIVTGVTLAQNVILGGVGGIFASGNTWNLSTQGSDASGHYPSKPLLNNDSPSASGKNFVLPAGDSNDLFQIQL